MRLTVFAILILGYIACSNSTPEGAEVVSAQVNAGEPIMTEVPENFKGSLTDVITEIQTLQLELRDKNKELEVIINLIKSGSGKEVPEGYQFGGFTEDLKQARFIPVKQTDNE